MKHRVPIAPLAGALAAGLAIATVTAPAQQPAGAPDAWAPSLNVRSAPVVEQQNGIRYLSGGVGLEERDEMRAAATGFDLRLMFSGARSGEFIAGVDVVIRDAQGRDVLVVPNAGPLLYAALPSGTYRVTAQSEGRTQTRTVTVQNGRLAESHLTWPDMAQGGPS